MSSPTNGPRHGFTGNLFLDNLASESAARLLPRLKKIDGPVVTVIAHAGTPINYVFFPVSAVISTVTRMRDGTDIEVMLIGREGLFGLQIALGGDVSASEAMVQIPNSL